MRNLFLVGLILSLVIFFISCEKDPLPDPVDCPNPPCNDEPAPSKLGVLDTLWSVPISSNSYRATEHIKLIDGVVYLSSGPSIFALNSSNGKQLYEWNDDDFGWQSSFEVCTATMQVILQRQSRIRSVDLVLGSTLTSYRQRIDGYWAGQRGALLGDYYYYTKRKSDRSTASLMRSHKNDLQNWEEIYTLIQGEDTRGSWANVESYNLWVNPNNGDSVIVFQHRMAVPDRVDVVAFSLNTREILWRHNDINTSGNSNHQQMLVMNDKAYIMAAEVVVAYDMFTGDVVWEHFDRNRTISFMFHKFEYAESIDALVVKGASPRLYALDPETGQEKLFIEDAGANSVSAGSPTYYNGIVYYITGSYFHAMRVATGEMLWKERSFMNTNSGFNGDVAIDKENGVLFAADGYFLYAIRAFED